VHLLNSRKGSSFDGREIVDLVNDRLQQEPNDAQNHQIYNDLFRRPDLSDYCDLALVDMKGPLRPDHLVLGRVIRTIMATHDSRKQSSVITLSDC